MFLYHITTADDYVLDFLLQYNKESSGKDDDEFNFKTFILCKNDPNIIEKIKSRNYRKDKIYVLLYENEENMYRHISGNDFKYVFYTYNFKAIWDKVNYFSKYIIYNIKLPSDITDFTVKISNNGDYTVDKCNHVISKNATNIELHSFFRNIFKSVNINCFIKDNTMLMYVGNNTSNPQVYEVDELKQNVATSASVATKQQNSVEKSSSTHKLVNGIYKSNVHNYNKNVDIDIINVCIIGDWIKSNELQKLWIRYCQEDNKWNNLRLVDENHSSIDYYIIINRANFSKPVEIPSDKCIVFHMEPNVEFIPWYREFAMYFNSNDLLFNGKHLYHKNNVDWHLSASYKDFKETDIVKTRGNAISMVMSSRKDNIGHCMRLSLAHKLDADSELSVQIFGKCDKEGFKNYKYELPYYCRDEAIIPYKYHFMAENTSIDNYFTEKIIDCILGETLCFYWGCPTLERFIDPRCFIRLPLHDPEESLKIIKSSIANDEWSKRIEFIRIAKYKLLNIYNLMPRVESILRLNTNTSLLLLSHQNKDEVQNFINNLVDQSFKNLMFKSITKEGFSINDLLEMCNIVVETKQNMFCLQYNNCFKTEDSIDRLLHDKICDTISIISQQKLTNNLIFLFRETQDINNIQNMDIYITVDVAKKVLDNAMSNKYKDAMELLSSLPIVRLKYIF
jgi:hypothetical protein